MGDFAYIFMILGTDINIEYKFDDLPVLDILMIMVGYAVTVCTPRFPVN